MKTIINLLIYVLKHSYFIKNVIRWIVVLKLENYNYLTPMKC